jgi:hypothetical protein
MFPLHPPLQRKHHVSNMYLPELDNDFLWPQSTPEGFKTDGWDGMLHLHAFEKVSGLASRIRCTRRCPFFENGLIDVDQAAVGRGRHR